MEKTGTRTNLCLRRYRGEGRIPPYLSIAYMDGTNLFNSGPSKIALIEYGQNLDLTSPRQMYSLRAKLNFSVPMHCFKYRVPVRAVWAHH